MKYTELLQYKTAASIGELGWTGASAAGGGLLGLLLSRIMHRKRSGLRDLLFALAGAGTGVAGINYAMDRKPGEGGMTWREKLQAADEILPAIQQKQNEQERREASRHTMSNLMAGTGAAWGAFRGARGEGWDISGRQSADKLLNTMMQSADNKAVLTGRAGEAARVHAAHDLGLDAGKGSRWNLGKARRRNIQRLIAKGTPEATDKGWRLTGGPRGRTAGSIAVDVVGNAGINAALLYAAGRLGEGLKSGIKDSADEIKNRAMEELNNR